MDKREYSQIYHWKGVKDSKVASKVQDQKQDVCLFLDPSCFVGINTSKLG